MGRTEGKLIPFLRKGLKKNVYPNLCYEDARKCEVFVLDFPRYDKSKPFAVSNQARILEDWHAENRRTYKYYSIAYYSVAKASFQASLKKSIYLIELPKINKKLRFREATSEETKEKHRRLKEKEKCRSNNLTTFNKQNLLFHETCDEIFAEDDPAAGDDVSLYAASNPQSVESSSSSGYQSGSGDELDEILDMYQELKTSPESLNELHPNSFDLVDYFSGNDLNDINFEKYGLLQNIKLDLDIPKPQVMDQQQNITPAVVEEICATKVDVSEFVGEKTYWLCTKKLKIDSLLLLICEKRNLEVGSQIAEGNTVIPNEVWGGGIAYILEKSLEVDGKKFLYLLPQSV